MTAYVPVLAAERAQLAGLAGTSAAVRDALVPLFDVCSLRDFRAPARLPRGVESPTQARLQDAVLAIDRAWGTERPAYVDCRQSADSLGDERLPDGRIHVACLLDEARTRGVPVIPVTGLRRSTAYQLSVADAANADGRGAALRVELPDFQELPTLEARTLAVVDTLGIAAERVDVIVDLGDIGRTQVRLLEVTARAVLAPLARVATWRSMTLVASAVSAAYETHVPRITPTSTRAVAMSDAGAAVVAPPLDPAHAIARTEWLLWRTMARAGSSAARRTLRFGDYTVFAPGGSCCEATSSVLYAHDDEWLVLDVAAESVSHTGPHMVPNGPHGAALASLAARPEFHGAAHCAGDARFAAGEHDEREPDVRALCAAAVTHHLTTVVEQLADI